MDFGSLNAPLKMIETPVAAFKNLFSGLGYFLGGDFNKAMESGFML